MKNPQHPAYGNLFANILSKEKLNFAISKKEKQVYFEIESRTIFIPMWKHMPDDVYRMFICHEAAHAIWTPGKEFIALSKENEALGVAVNIVEDARIERKMKNRYPGVKKDFISAYKFLQKKDFFDLRDKDISELSLLNRVNLYFKLGLHCDVEVPFSEDEMEILDEVYRCQTFEDVVEAAKKLLEMSNDEMSQPDEMDVIKKAMDCMMMKQPYEDDFVDLQLPDSTICDFGKFLDSEEPFYKKKFYGTEPFGQVIIQSRKDVGFMISEFERKKAAGDYIKTKLSKTGVIDPNKLVNYKTHEDIFRTNEVKPIGKNHGIVIFLDMSGSMDRILKDTVLQVIELGLFCTKMNIPFEIWGFFSWHPDTLNIAFPTMYKDGELHLDPSAYMSLLATCKSSRKDILSNFESLFNFSCAATRMSDSTQKYAMCGTSLTTCMILSKKILKDFIVRNKIEKSIGMYISDGEATDPVYYKNDGKIEMINPCLQYKYNCLWLKDVENKKYYSRNNVDRKIFEEMILQNVKDVTKSKLIGYFLRGSHPTDPKVTIKNVAGYDAYYEINTRSCSSDDRSKRVFLKHIMEEIAE